MPPLIGPRLLLYSSPARVGLSVSCASSNMHLPLFGADASPQIIRTPSSFRGTLPLRTRYKAPFSRRPHTHPARCPRPTETPRKHDPCFSRTTSRLIILCQALGIPLLKNPHHRSIESPVPTLHGFWQGSGVLSFSAPLTVLVYYADPCRAPAQM